MNYQKLGGFEMDARELASLQDQTRTAEAAVFKLANSVSQLKRLVDQLGTQRDTQELRHKVSDANVAIQSHAKAIKLQLTALHDSPQPSTSGLTHGPGSYQPLLPRPDSQQSLKLRKLLQDFTAILQDYKATQKVAAEREAASLPRATAVAASTSGRGGGFELPPSSSRGEGTTAGHIGVEVGIERAAQQQAMKAAEHLALDNAISYNEALIAERDEGIAEITKQIVEVNEMFQDLAVLINDQGAQVEVMDQNITTTAERVREGTQELTKANRHMAKARNKCLCVWLVAALVVSLILVLLFA